MAECDRRILQREVSRRVSQPAVVSEPGRSDSGHRPVAAALQRGPPAFEPGLSDAGGVHSELSNSAPRGRRSPVIPGPKKPGRSCYLSETLYVWAEGSR